MEILSVEQLTFYFEQKYIIADSSFAVNDGDIIYLKGKSGAGKTTLLKILAGILKPSFGKVKILNQELEYSFKKDKIAINKIGFLFQDVESLHIKNIVREDILFAVDLLPKQEQEIRMTKVLDLFKNTALTSILNRSIFTLSASEKMLVSLAGVLIKQPQILFLDEPFCTLDDVLSREVLSMIKSYVSQFNAAVIFTSHKQKFENNIANRVLKIDERKLMEESI